MMLSHRQESGVFCLCRQDGSWSRRLCVDSIRRRVNSGDTRFTLSGPLTSPRTTLDDFWGGKPKWGHIWEMTTHLLFIIMKWKGSRPPVCRDAFHRSDQIQMGGGVIFINQAVSVLKTKKQSLLNCCMSLRFSGLLVSEIVWNGGVRTGRTAESRQALLHVSPQLSPSLTLMAELQCDWTVPANPSELQAGHETKPRRKPGRAQNTSCRVAWRRKRRWHVDPTLWFYVWPVVFRRVSARR